jgi:hypothetical protein
MMCGGGGITEWMIGEVVTEDEEGEELERIEGVICSFVVGDWTSWVQRCKMVGSRMIPVTKLSDRVLTRLGCGKVSSSGF